MTRIPRSPLILGLAGLVPFIWGALIASGYLNANMGDPENGGYPLIVANDGRLLLTSYGTIILSFMSGVLWGFATKADGPQATVGYILSVIPALWVFLAPSKSADEALLNLIIGFISVILLDFAFSRWGLTPTWWMPLRILLTTIAVICLAIGMWI